MFDLDRDPSLLETERVESELSGDALKAYLRKIFLHRPLQIFKPNAGMEILAQRAPPVTDGGAGNDFYPGHVGMFTYLPAHVKHLMSIVLQIDLTVFSFMRTWLGSAAYVFVTVLIQELGHPDGKHYGSPLTAAETLRQEERIVG